MTAVQIPLDLGYRPAQGREDFLIAPSNEEAVAWIDRWPDWAGAPALVIYGPAASGKGHLAAVWGEKSGAALVETDAPSRQTADEIAAQGTHLIVRNIDLWCGDRPAETTLFHLYNLMKEEKRFLLFTMRMAPTRAGFILPDLASRLRAAPAAMIDVPDDTLLGAVLVKLFADRQLQIGTEVLHYLLPRMERSFAAARDIVEAADRLALSERRPISVPLIRRVLLAREGA
ncbi:MAG: DNA replication protein [Alphaproteobacteria bacterium]|nr:DNA replication protein [Alphaproteobacteria bacterium]